MSLTSGKPLDQIEGERRCAHPRCRARLSRYNPDGTCGAHGGWADGKEPRARGGAAR